MVLLDVFKTKQRVMLLKDDEKYGDISFLLVVIILLSIFFTFVFDGIDNDLPPLQNTIDDSPFESKKFENNSFEE